MSLQSEILKVLNQEKNFIDPLSNEDLKCLQAVLLEIYRDVYSACMKHGIPCFLVGGSALGAIRHNGFIPWDDDLDIAVFRNDYDKLPEIVECEYPEKYAFSGPGFSDCANNRILNIEKKGTVLKSLFDSPSIDKGCRIDVFPLENIPKSKLLRKWHGFWTMFLFNVATSVKLYKNPNRRVEKILRHTRKGRLLYLLGKATGFFFSFRTYTSWYVSADRYVSKYKEKETGFYGIPSGRGHYNGEIYAEETVLPPREVVYEGKSAMVFNKIEAYLTKIYKDYTFVPPPEMRERHFYVEFRL